MVPEGGIVVGAKFFIEENIVKGVDFYASRGGVPAEFAVVVVLVPFVVDEFAIVMGFRRVKVERSGLASMTSVGTPEVS